MKLRLFLTLLVLAFTLPNSVDAQTPRYARVISENANLRDTPSVASASEQEVAEGTVIKVLDEKLPWYVVRVGNRVGWMHGNTIEFIGIQNPATETPRQQTVVPDQPSAPSLPRRESSAETPPRTTSGNRSYIRGPRGGCYYYSGSGRKVYVEPSVYRKSDGSESSRILRVYSINSTSRYSYRTLPSIINIAKGWTL